MQQKKSKFSFLMRFLVAAAVISCALEASTSKAANQCAELFEARTLSENQVFQAELYKLELIYHGKLEVEQSEGANGLKFIILKDQATKKEVAELNYRYNEATKELSIKWIETTKQNLGVAHTLFAAALATHPETKSISTTVLLATNEEVVKQKLAEGMTIENAIKQTPAYKLRKSLGYETLLKDSINEDYGFTVEKSAK